MPGMIHRQLDDRPRRVVLCGLIAGLTVISLSPLGYAAYNVHASASVSAEATIEASGPLGADAGQAGAAQSSINVFSPRQQTEEIPNPQTVSGHGRDIVHPFGENPPYPRPLPRWEREQGEGGSGTSLRNGDTRSASHTNVETSGQLSKAARPEHHTER